MSAKQITSSELRAHASRLKAHAKLLEANTRAVASLAASNKALSTGITRFSVTKPRRVLGLAQIKAGIAQALGVDPSSLHDTDKITIGGGLAAELQFITALNGVFWHDGHWRILPKDIQSATVGSLAQLIRQKLLAGN